MANSGRSNSGRKNRKYGRNKAFCERYRAEGRREINKARKAATRARREAKHKASVAELALALG